MPRHRKQVQLVEEVCCLDFQEAVNRVGLATRILGDIAARLSAEAKERDSVSYNYTEYRRKLSLYLRSIHHRSSSSTYTLGEAIDCIRTTISSEWPGRSKTRI